MANDEKDQPSIWGQPFQKFATDAIHAGQEPEQWNSMMVVPPITVSSTYKQYSPENHAGYKYCRIKNPSRDVLETCVAALDGAKHGLAFSSGAAATATCMQTLKTGDHIISSNDVYCGTNRYIKKIAANSGLELSFVDFTDLKDVEAALLPNTKMVWMETPTNPTMKVTDIKAVSDLVHKYNSDVKIVVDNTFMTSYFQRPLLFGADAVMYSATKYMNGHSDVVMGLLTTNDEELIKQLRFLQYAMGPVPSPFDCFLVNRGLKTLAIRMEQHQKNAIAVAKYLEVNPRVTKTVYAGSESHPQFHITKKQAIGCSGMIGFWMQGNLENCKNFFTHLKVFTLAESLGGYESLAEHPAIMTHGSVPSDQNEKSGISDTFVRLSVGLENVEDLIADLDQALTAAVSSNFRKYNS
uniref:Cystathionine gamma-lyase n=1 Tax=Phallusia mammillata TaxID=59560 RepID=A0A6F9D9I2_9ASCI|nr:cystathionine gamma-lyase [Phallusia mammillata]